MPVVDLPARLAGQPTLGMILLDMSRRVSPLCDEPVESVTVNQWGEGH